jgi:hypothetical protein
VLVTPAEMARFWKYVDRRGPGECWPWTGATRSGYGCLTVKVDGKPKSRRAARMAWALANGRPLGPGMMALHRCDNPPCCNPAHLYEGTAADNMADKVARGRQSRSGARNPARGDRNGARLHPERLRRGASHPWRLHPERVLRGERHPNAKLSDEDVQGIRDAVASGQRQADVAARYGITQGHVSAVKRGRARS